jgi:predicted AAA+ superfamily ATPase
MPTLAMRKLNKEDKEDKEDKIDTINERVGMMKERCVVFFGACWANLDG